jgi:glycosyltransferase involved in cell wall biosynthesis
MSCRETITPLILTLNEAPNIRHTLEKLTWAKEIVLLDSFSTDDTLEIARAFPQVRIVQRKFDTHSAQWNFGLEQCGTPWILALDADYSLSDELLEELQALEPRSDVVAYFAKFKYCVSGRPLRGALYPPRAVLFQERCCRYEQDGHTQRLRVDGGVAWLRGFINHDDRKSLDRWLHEQNRYAEIEARHLQETPLDQLCFPDRTRRMVVLAPLLVFFYTLLGKGLILDGWPGWYYVFQRTLAEMILSLRLIEQKWKRHLS